MLTVPADWGLDRSYVCVCSIAGTTHTNSLKSLAEALIMYVVYVCCCLEFGPRPYILKKKKKKENSDPHMCIII